MTHQTNDGSFLETKKNIKID